METEKTFHSGFVAILGRPNVGKSTLMNALVGEKVAIVSPRSQTTRNRIMGILTGDDYQAVFLDTPGLHTPRNKLGETMVKAAKEALDGADALLVMVDAGEVREADRKIIEEYANTPMRKALVVNKLDAVPHDRLMELMNTFHDVGYDEVIPISALKKKNLERLSAIIRAWLPQGPQYFPGDMVTDQPERFLIAEMIREKALRNLREEIPHGVGVEILEIAGQGTGMVTIHANIYCEKASHKGILIGKQGAMLRTIGERARADVERLLGERVNLQLWIKVREDWRNRQDDLNTLGYL
jgi:GTP-binding protein Era